jgi:hypothetical protein
MSSTNRGAQRSEADDYATPGWCVDRLLEGWPHLLDYRGRWIEPCAGEGSIIRSVELRAPRTKLDLGIDWTAVELRRTSAELTRLRRDGAPIVTARTGVDFFVWYRSHLRRLRQEGCEGERFEVFLTNPPFSLAEEILRAGLEIAKHVVLLLRLNFLGSVKRYPFLKDAVPRTGVLPNRPTFTLDGHTDSIEYAWMHWEAGNLRPRNEVEVFATTPKEVRKEERLAVIQSK